MIPFGLSNRVAELEGEVRALKNNLREIRREVEDLHSAAHLYISDPRSAWDSERVSCSDSVKALLEFWDFKLLRKPEAETKFEVRIKGVKAP